MLNFFRDRLLVLENLVKSLLSIRTLFPDGVALPLRLVCLGDPFLQHPVGFQVLLLEYVDLILGLSGRLFSLDEPGFDQVDLLLEVEFELIFLLSDILLKRRNSS